MLIGNKYKIETDKQNIILSEKYQKKKDDDVEEEEVKEGWKEIGFFATISNALKFMVENEIKGTGLEDLKLLNNRITELHILIMALKIEKESLTSVE